VAKQTHTGGARGAGPSQAPEKRPPPPFFWGLASPRTEAHWSLASLAPNKTKQDQIFLAWLGLALTSKPNKPHVAQLSSGDSELLDSVAQPRPATWPGFPSIFVLERTSFVAT
jgi:hypothetical protein